MGAVESSSCSQKLQSSLVETPTAPLNDGFLPEILEELASFLVGYDVLQLSHVCRTFRETFNNTSVWERRLKPFNASAAGSAPMKSAWCDAQIQYFRARSFYFRGLAALPSISRKNRSKLYEKVTKTKLVERLHLTKSTQCGDFCELPNSLLPSNGHMSFELWFSLDSSTSQGGILLGHQSQSCQASDKPPPHYQRIVHIDPEHNLYCSVLASKPIIAHNLEPTRWGGIISY